MNILITVFDLHFGGINNLLANTLIYYPKAINIHFVYFGPNETMLNHFEKDNIKVSKIPYRGLFDYPSAVWALWKYIKLERITIIHCHTGIDSFIAAIVRCFNKKIKIISTLHSADQPYSNQNSIPFFLREKSLDFIKRFLFDGHIAVSNASKDMWVKYRWQKKSKVTVIYNGIKGLENHLITDKGSLKNEAGIVEIITACRLHPIKGLPRLIQLLSTLPSHLNWQLTILGEGEERNKLEKIIEDYHLENKVKLQGYTDNVKTYYQNASFYINSSFSEAFSIALLESLSIGLPLLVSDVGGNKEILEEGINGFIIDFSEVDKAREVLIKALQLSDEEYCRLSINAYRCFQQTYSVDKHVHALHTYYQEIIA